MARERILVVEDEQDILELITYNLKREGYTVEGATSGEDGLDMALESPPDLVILDLMLPGLDGLEVCKQLRNDARTKYLPIIMLTAKSDDIDMVTGLELGADDYMAKPFSPRVLLARIKTVFRRVQNVQRQDNDEGSSIRMDGLDINPGRHEVRIDGKKTDLTFTEFKVLHLLAKRPGWVYSRYQIVDGIRGTDYIVTERAVDVQIVGLRRKLGEYADYIETVRGVGYRFRATE